MRKRLLLPGLAMAMSVALVPSQVEAQDERGFQVGPVLAFHDHADLGIGGVVLFGLESLDASISFMGDLTVFFPGGEDVDYWELNPNLIWDFPLEDSEVLPFALGGLNIARGSGDTDLGLNAGGGVKFGERKNFIAGARVELGGGEGLVLFGMVPFAVGGG